MSLAYISIRIMMNKEGERIYQSLKLEGFWLILSNVYHDRRYLHNRRQIWTGKTNINDGQQRLHLMRN